MGTPLPILVNRSLLDMEDSLPAAALRAPGRWERKLLELLGSTRSGRCLGLSEEPGSWALATP